MSKTRDLDEDSLSVFCGEYLLELLVELRNKGGRPKKQKEEQEVISMKRRKEINLKGFLQWKDTVNFENLGVD
jgi:methionyl-tRNA formyltransferase